MTYERELPTDAAHALTHNQEVWSDHGWAVVTAGGLTSGSNALQLDVGQYEVLTGGTASTTVGPATIDAQLPTDEPYWLVVYVDGSGSLQTAAGPEGAVAPGLGVDVREISSPPPPTLASAGPVTVLGRALVTDDGIADSRIDDRVFASERVFDTIAAASGQLESLTVTNGIDAGSVSARSIGGDFLYAGSFGGADADARLDNALASASRGTMIYLEAVDYTADHTINSESISLIGSGAHSTGSSINNALFDFQGYLCLIQNVGMNCDSSADGIQMGFGGQAHNIREVGGKSGTITATGAKCVFSRLKDVDVILDTNRCVVDSSVGVAVTDNGSGNVTGDIA